MDNLTHTLIGLVAGETLARHARAVRKGLPADVRRGLFVTIGTIGGSLPDTDLLVTYGGFAPGKLGYLLHHRGHTHTVVGCLVLAALLYAAVEGWARLRRLTLVREDRLALAGMAALSVLLHLFMDALNSYGVHPWWPFWNGWLYGDMLFIIEPLFWIAAAPMLFIVKTWVARIVIGVVVALALIALTFVYQSQPVWPISAAVLAIALLIAGRRWSARAGSLLSAGLMVAFISVFAGSGFAASKRAEAIAVQSFPSEDVLDVSLTPAPANPLCWEVLFVQAGGPLFTVRHAVLSIAPALLSADRCPRVRPTDNRTAPLQPVGLPDRPGLHWFGELATEKTRLRDLVARHCEARELMQFVRVPFVAKPGEAWVLGDLRFDREPSLGFTEIELRPGPSADCRHDVPWVPPRADLLRD